MKTTLLFSLVLIVVLLLIFEAKPLPSRAAVPARPRKRAARAAGRGALLPATGAPGGLAFDADRVAYLEKAGWEAYYDRNWLRLSC